MRYETRLKFDAPLLKSAVAAYWKRSIGIVLPIVFLVVAADFGFLIFRGDRSWWIGVMATVLALVPIYTVALYVIHYRNVFRKFRELGPEDTRFIADETGFTVESTGKQWKLRSTTIHWSLIREVWRFPTFWLLLFSKAHFMTVPLACLPQGMDAFVLQRVRAAGGKIK